jgi:hypothetical protein
MLAEGLQSATTATDQSLTELASSQGMFNLQRPTVGPPPPPPPAFGLRRPTDTLTALATGFAPDPPIPLRRDLVDLDLGAGARSAREFGAALEEGARGDVFRRGRFTPRAAGHLGAVLRETGLRPEEFQAIAEAAEGGHPEARAFIDQVRQPLAEEETGMAIAGLAGIEGQQTDFGGTLVDIAQRFPDILSPTAAANLSNRIQREGGIVPGLGREQLPAEGTTLLSALRAEVEFLRPVTEPIGRFAGGLIGQQLAPTTPPPLRALGVPDISGTQRARDIGAAVGGAVAPEVLVPSNVIPIPIADEVLRVLAKGVPLAARLLTRSGRAATRAELRELATAAGRWLSGAAPISPAERELGQQGVEALTREAAEAGPARAAGEVAPPAARPSQLLQVPEDLNVVRFEPEVPGATEQVARATIRTDGIEVQVAAPAFDRPGAPQILRLDIERVSGRGLEGVREAMEVAGRLAAANPDRELRLTVTNKKLADLLVRRFGATVRLETPELSVLNLPREALPGAAPAPAAGRVDVTAAQPMTEGRIRGILEFGGEGAPGLEVRGNELIFRNTAGEAIGFAEIVRTARGDVLETLVIDPAATGMSRGRALQALTKAAGDRGIVGVGGTVTPEAERLLGRLGVPARAAEEATPGFGSVEEQIAAMSAERGELRTVARQWGVEPGFSPGDMVARIESQKASFRRVQAQLHPDWTDAQLDDAVRKESLRRDSINPDTGQAWEAAPARAAGEPVPQVAGGSPLTAAEVASRRAAGADLLAEAIPQSGSRAGRDVWRRFFGARQLSAKERLVWSRQVYRDAERGGFKIAARGETQADEVVGIMERVMSEQRAPINNFPERQRPFVQSLYDRIDRTTQRLVDADPDFANIALEDYFPHLFKPIKPGAARLGSATGFVTKPGFKRPRKLTGTLGEILNDRPDLDLVSWDPVDFVTRHEAAADNYIASLEAIRAGKASGHILPTSQAPAGWVRPDFAPFKLRQTLQHWVMEPKFAQTMEQMFGKSAFDKHGVLKLAKQARTTAFGLKVFGGLFQQLDFMWRGAGLGVSELARGRPAQALKAGAAWPRAIARGLSPGVDDALNKAALKNPELKALYDHGLAAGVDPSFSETALRDVAGELAPIPGVRQVLETLTTKWYGRFHTEMLEQAALVNLQKNLRKGLPLEEAARLAVEETNVFFSSIPAWQSVWKSATVRDAMKFPFFATGELEGWFRLPVQAPAGFAGMMATTVAVAEMMSLAFTGKPLSLEQLTPFQRERDGLKPSNILTGDIPFVDFNTGFLRPELPWKGPMGRTLYLDLLGQADTPFRWALDPGFATQTRLGQLPRLAIDLASIARGEAPPFGEVVKGPLDALQFVLQQVSPISISGLTGTERGRIGVAGAGTQVGGFNVSAEPLFELLGRRFEELTGQSFNRETDFVRARQMPELASILEEMRNQGVAVGSEGAVAAEAREEVVQQAARDSLTQFADGVRAGNADAGQRFGEKFSDWKTFAAGAAELLHFGRDFTDPTTPEGQILAEFYEITPDAFLDGDPEEGTFTTDWVAFENARDEKLAQMPQEWRDAYEAQLRLPPELQDVEARYNAARELRNELEDVGEFEGLSREDYQLVKRLRAAVTRAREEAWNDPGRSGRELAPVRSFIETEGQRLGYDERLINWTLALTSERHRARNYNPAYVDFLAEHEAELRLFYPQLFTRRVTDELLRRS